MEKHEQLDALSFKISDICNGVQPKLTGENSETLTDYIHQLNCTVNRYLSEFDIEMFEVVGILEDTKMSLLMDAEEIAPDIIGCLETVKLSLLLGADITFTADDDIFDEDDDIFDEDDDNILPFGDTT
jgi:hypothetical protein